MRRLISTCEQLRHFSLLTRTLNLHQVHTWFKDVVWEKLYEMEAAYKPEVNDELDTQNFMKFDEVCHKLFLFHYLALFEKCFPG